jgi:hypothetical protein
MGIPKSVQKDAAAADAALIDLSTSLDEEQAAAVDDLGDLGQTPTAEVAEDTPNVEGTVEEGVEFIDDLFEPTEVPSEQLDDAPTSEGTIASEGLVDYEQMYRSLQGKYDNEVPVLHANLSRLEGKLEVMETIPATVPVELPSAGDGFKRHLTDDEVEEYGSGVLDLHSRMVRGVVEELLQTQGMGYDDRLAVLENSQLASMSDRFWERVERVYRGARRINDADPQWFEFLKRRDNLSGLSYRELGENAVEIGDVERMVSLLSMYKPLKPSATRPKKPAAKPRPSTGRVSVPASEPAKGKIRESTIKKFYTDQALGAFAGHEDEAQKREDEIILAYEEDRVISG